MSKAQSAAKAYLSLGFKPIAQFRDKSTFVRWGEFQKRPPTADDLDRWFTSDRPDLNVALMMGSGIFVLDFDGPKAEEAFKAFFAQWEIPASAPVVKTSQGFHVYLSTDEDLRFDHVDIFNSKPRGWSLDVKGLGLATVPPSVHKSGAVYEWLSPLKREIPRAPAKLLEGLRAKHGERKAHEVKANTGENWVADALTSGVSEGGRDEMATRLAGYFIGKGLDRDVVSVILTETFGRNCSPPFPAREVEKCVKSVERRHVRNDEGETKPVVKAVKIDEAITDFLKSLEAPPVKRAPTPMRLLNWKLDGGFGPGELIFLAARAGQGKTALALQFAKEAAATDFKTLIVSAEMLIEPLIRRMISQNGVIVTASDLKRREFDDAQLREVVQTTSKLGRLPIWLTDKAQTFGEVYDLATTLRAEHGLDFVVVDYLQRIHDPKLIKDRRLEVEKVSSGLKSLAVELEIPILVLSGVSRSKDNGGKYQRPTISSLRESGMLEHDADTILILDRGPEADSPEGHIYVDKQRDGETGPVKLDFEARRVRFFQADQGGGGEYGG